jgi:hypothetical protein
MVSADIHDPAAAEAPLAAPSADVAAQRSHTALPPITAFIEK